MSDSRERFEAWAKAPPFEFDLDRFNGIEAWPGAYRNYPTHCAWDAWQAAEAETARRCAEIADRIAVDYRAKYKGLPGADGIRRGGSYDPHDDGISDGGTLVDDAIRAEFPEAFK